MVRLRALCGLTVALCINRRTCAEEDVTCPATGGPAHCRQGADAAGMAAAIGKPSAAPSPALHSDLISQEMEQLEAIINTSEQRVRLLTELRDGLEAGHKPDVPEQNVRVLQAKMPLLSEVPKDSLLAPVASPDDYLVQKTVIPSDQEINFVKFMPLRSSRGSSSSSSTQTPLPTALLVTAGIDGEVRLFSPAGDMVLYFSAGHEQSVTHLAVSLSHDEYLIATSDASGAIRTHKVTVRQRRMSRTEKQARRSSWDEKVSQHLGSPMNVTVQLYRQMQVPQESDGEAPSITALALASQGGSKYLLAGDAEGKVSIFTRNGTLRSRVDTTTSPGQSVEGLSPSPGGVLFRSGAEWGYVDLEKLEVKHVECPKFEGRLTSAALDSQLASRVLGGDEAGTVWVFNVKNKRDCTVELRFPEGATRGPIDLASVRGYAIGLEGFGVPGEPVALVALNMSSLGKGKGGKQNADTPIPPPPKAAVVWRRPRAPVRAWAVHRRAKEGDLVALLSEDGREVEVLELLMQVYTPPPADAFGNFKMPVIAVAVILVLGYQYMKQKGKGGGGGGFGGGKGGLGNTDLASALRNKKKFGNLKGRR